MRTEPAPAESLTKPYFMREDAPEVNPCVVPAGVRSASPRSSASDRAPLQSRLTSAAQDAMDTLEGILTDPNAKPQLKQATAIWLLEKITGKPTQPLDHGSSTLSEFLILLEAQARTGRAVGPTSLLPSGSPVVIDATFTEETERTPEQHTEVPSDPSEESAIQAWVRENT